MLANNEYKDFRTKSNDEYKEMNLNGHEHEFLSNTSIELDMNCNR